MLIKSIPGHITSRSHTLNVRSKLIPDQFAHCIRVIFPCCSVHVRSWRGKSITTAKLLCTYAANTLRKNNGLSSMTRYHCFIQLLATQAPRQLRMPCTHATIERVTYPYRWHMVRMPRLSIQFDATSQCIAARSRFLCRPMAEKKNSNFAGSTRDININGCPPTDRFNIFWLAFIMAYLYIVL